MLFRHHRNSLDFIFIIEILFPLLPFWANIPPETLEVITWQGENRKWPTTLIPMTLKKAVFLLQT